MKKIFLLLAIFTSIIACKKDDEIVALTPAEQSKVDDDRIVEYMKSYKIEGFHVGLLPRNIDWKIVPLTDEDDESTETLFDLMGENIISTNFAGVDYKMYYYNIDVGSGSEITSTDRVYVDYNLFSIFDSEMKDRTDYTEFSVAKFNLPDLIEGWKLGIDKFNSGTKSSEFPTEGTPTAGDYRELVDNPGRGVLLVPSGLAYGPGSNVLRFDVVTYDNVAVEEE